MDSLLDKAPVVYFSSTDDGTVLEANQSFYTATGFIPEEIIGKKTDLFFPVATRIFFQTHFFPLLKIHGQATEIYITLQGKNRAQLPVLVNAERTTDGATTAIRFLGIIVHNRKKFEDELVAARKTAEASLRENTALLELKQELQQRMEQLELHMRQARQQHSELMQFNRVVTHDLQEPIRKISIFSNMLVSVTDQDPKPMVEKLIRSLSHMRAIVSGLQQYVWLTETPTRLQMVHLPAMLLTAQQQLQQEVPDLDLVVECGDLPAVHADPDQLQVLLYHLLSNAFRFRKQNSTAVVTVQGILLQKNRFVAVKDQYRYEDHVQLTFTDNGQGFDPVYKEEVFRLFCRIHAESGRGVGLALCKKIMENHRGHISISTQPDKGSTVTLILPLSAETESVR